MSVVAWDGKTLASDSQGTLGDTKVYSQKVAKVVIDGEACLLGWVGHEQQARAKVQWFLSGKVGDYPKDTDETWARLIVVHQTGVILLYELYPTPLPWGEDKGAWGSGMQAAYAALDLGCDSIQAVEAAIRRADGCGGVVQAVSFDETNNKPIPKGNFI